MLPVLQRSEFGQGTPGVGQKTDRQTINKDSDVPECQISGYKVEIFDKTLARLPHKIYLERKVQYPIVTLSLWLIRPAKQFSR